MSDHGEIASIIARNAFRVDDMALDNFGDDWFDEATLTYIDVDGNRYHCASLAEILSMIRSSYQPPLSQPCLHIVTTPVIDLDGDRARVRYYTIHTRHGPMAQPCGVGEYDVNMRKDGEGRWRITAMTQVQRLAYDRTEAA